MNTTLPSIRPPRSWRCQLRDLSGALLIVCALIAATAAKAKAEYAFTLVADSAGPFSDFDFPSPSLNKAGTVAFAASLDDGRSGIFAGNGGIVTTIALAAQPNGRFGYPSINQAGTVAFSAFRTNGLQEGILAGNGGPLVTIADTTGQFRGFAAGYTASINSVGAVAFWGALDTGSGGIFVGNGGAVTPVLINSVSLSSDFNVSMNDTGTVAFRRGNETSILTINGGLITTIADSSGPFNYFGAAPSLNEVGRVAFVAGVNGIDGGVFGIYSGNGGPLTTIADLSGPFSYLGDFNFGQPSINGSGSVAFVAGLDAGGGGLYTGDGAATSEVIGSGDPLFGSIITALTISPTSLNDAGQVAFYYELANGTTGIAIANPVPEPGGVSLLIGGLLTLLGSAHANRRNRAENGKLRKGLCSFRVHGTQ